MFHTKYGSEELLGMRTGTVKGTTGGRVVRFPDSDCPLASIVHWMGKPYQIQRSIKPYGPTSCSRGAYKQWGHLRMQAMSTEM